MLHVPCSSLGPSIVSLGADSLMTIVLSMDKSMKVEGHVGVDSGNRNTVSLLQQHFCGFVEDRAS